MYTITNLKINPDLLKIPTLNKFIKDDNSVDFEPTYDGEDEEPCVMPAAFPNLLANGSSGIAVGMATNIPTHNLGEVIDGTITVPLRLPGWITLTTIQALSSESQQVRIRRSSAAQST